MYTAMTMTYGNTVAALASVFEGLREDNLPDVLSKGGVGTILLANALSHTIMEGGRYSDKGADGFGENGENFEYKVSKEVKPQFNFNFGGRHQDSVGPNGESCEYTEQTIREHFGGIVGAICAVRIEHNITKAIFCPTDPLVDYLIIHFQTHAPKSLVKNFSFPPILAIDGAVDITDLLYNGHSYSP